MITGTLGDIDPLNKVPFKRATSGVQKGPLEGVSRRLPRILRGARGELWGFGDAKSLRFGDSEFRPLEESHGFRVYRV